MRRLSVTTVLCALIGCAVGPAGPAETAVKVPSPSAFAGAWRSVTPSLEIMELSITSKSSEMGAFGVRLTFSGVAWEGSGTIAGDSLVAVMTIVGAPTASGVIVAHARDVQTLRTQFRSSAAAPLDLTFVRGD